MISLSEELQSWFVPAGWFCGRKVPIAADIPTGHPAAEVLATFGGLVVLWPSDPGAPDEVPGDAMAFRRLAPNRPLIEEWEARLGTELIGVADVDSLHGELYVASDGRCFGRSHVHPAFYYHGETYEEAFRSILLKEPRARPMLAPDQTSVRLYGIEFTVGSAELYRY